MHVISVMGITGKLHPGGADSKREKGEKKESENVPGFWGGSQGALQQVSSDRVKRIKKYAKGWKETR